MAGWRDAARTMWHILTDRKAQRKALLADVERRYAEDVAALQAFYSNPANLESETAS